MEWIQAEVTWAGTQEAVARGGAAVPLAFSVVWVHLVPCVHTGAWCFVGGHCAELASCLSSVLADYCPLSYRSPLALHATPGTAVSGAGDTLRSRE